MTAKTKNGVTPIHCVGSRNARASPRDHLAGDGERDVGAAAEHEDRLHFAEGVLHDTGSFTRRRSEAGGFGGCR